MYTIKKSGIISELKSRIDKHEVISFDIFDTLLLRPYVKPQDLFYHLEKLNNEEYFAQKRIYAYRIALKQNSQCEEVTFEQIYQVLGKRYEYLKQQELDIEEAVLAANPEMLEIYNYAKAKNKKIIVVSDMYLPKTFVEKVLQKNGYVAYNKLYLSSELNKTKHSSSLYKFILDDLKIDSQKILHIGDNQHSDCDVANSMGFAVFYYEKIIDRFFKNNPKSLILHDLNPDDIGISIILGISAIKSLTCEGNYWQKLGYDYAGPIAYGYTQWLNKKFKEDNIKDALFVARDGYTLQKVFSLFNNNNVKTHYFYAPRLFYCAIQLNPKNQFNDEKKNIVLARFILNYYKDKHPFLQVNTPEINSSAEGINFINANFQIYQDLALNEMNEYLKYINSENIGTGNIALVDFLSFSLSSQKLVNSFMINNNIYGYYWWFFKESNYEIPEYNCCNYQKGEKVIAGWPFVEFLITAPSAPIQSVSNGKPIYKDNISAEEQFRMEKYPFVSEGAVGFASDVQKYFGNMPVFINYKNIADLISIITQKPSNEDIKYLQMIEHSEDSDHSIYTPLFHSWFNEKANAESSNLQHKN